MASVTYEEQLHDLIRTDERVMQLLRTVRSLGLTEWCIAAGTIRNPAWDHLHAHDEATLPSDIDVLIFDTTHTDSDYGHELERRVASLVPSVTWEVVNQATIHTYTGDVRPYTSIVDAMSRWADLVTAVGAHLDADDRITILAPGGLSDLFELRVWPNIVTPTSESVYRERMASKGWASALATPRDRRRRGREHSLRRSASKLRSARERRRGSRRCSACGGQP